MSISGDNSGSSKKSSRKGQKIEVCLLGVNEAIGRSFFFFEDTNWIKNFETTQLIGDSHNDKQATGLLQHIHGHYMGPTFAVCKPHMEYGSLYCRMKSRNGNMKRPKGRLMNKRYN